LALAKTEAALLNLTEQFRNRTVQKEYLAWVDGTPSPASGVVENQLGKLKVFQGQTLWGAVKQGSYAKTSWSVVKTKDNKSLVLCRPETGRTHQIRIHLADLGHPILGDSTYGKRFRSPYRPSRILLHASKLSFTHPKTALPLAVEAPLPKAFQELM
jgi:RluA family pseudouridine synthase